MWVLNRGWWWTWVILLAPGVIALVIGILNPAARTDDDIPLRTFGVVWIALQLMLMGVMLAFMKRQRHQAAYFQQNGIPGTATILHAETTGTTVNDMPRVALTLEIDAPGRNPYTITDRRCWNPLQLAGLQRGAKLAVLVDPRNPKSIMFADEGQAPPITG
jgi:hypothetical protein